MEYKHIEQKIDLNDPEEGFHFESIDDKIFLSLTDWQNRKLSFQFSMVYFFSYRLANGYKNLPEAMVLEVLASDVIDSLRKDSTASANEELHHFIISTNEDEWCEV